MTKIKEVIARQILDSRGNPTVEVEVTTALGIGRAMVPSGASTGTHEAVELRDKKKAFHGKGVSKAISHVRSLGTKLKGKTFTQESLDLYLCNQDGTVNKRKLGANALLGISIAFAKSHSSRVFQTIGLQYRHKPTQLPLPCFNLINGGKHAGTALQIQEYHLNPTGAKTYSQAVQIGSEVYQELKKILKKTYGGQATNVGDEGGFAPPMKKYTEPFDMILKAADECGYAKKISLGIDAAASEFYTNGRYTLEKKKLTCGKLLDIWSDTLDHYPLKNIEDPFHEEAYEDFAELKYIAGKRSQIMGDDLTVTNPARIQRAIDLDSCNALLLKVNQIGTLTEALQAAKLAKAAGWNIMVSHRSGDTVDPFIADLAVGIGAEQIKSGAPCRGERVEKYNQLLRIEEHLGKKATFRGKMP
jgi:enolase